MSITQPALFQDNISTVYYHLKEAGRGMTNAASIKPYQRGKDGHGAFLELMNQYAGKD